MNFEPKRGKHLKLGVVSSLTALLAYLLSFSMFVAFFVPDADTDAARKIYEVTFVFVLIAAPLFHLTGLALGLCGLFADGGERFAVVGILLNGLALAIAAVCWALILCLAFLVINAGGASH